MKEFNPELDQEILEIIFREFNPENFVKVLKQQFHDIESASPTLEEYGKKLAYKAIELGEERTDGIYEVMKEAIEKTGEMKFPLIPQRYVEIVYLSVQPIKRLWTLMNSKEAYSFKLDRCSIYTAIKNEYGEEVAKRMTCKKICLTIIGEIFSHFGFTVETSMKTNMADEGSCEFIVKRKQK